MWEIFDKLNFNKVKNFSVKDDIKIMRRQVTDLEKILAKTCLIKASVWKMLSFMLLLLLFSCPVVSDSATPCTAARQASLSLAVSRSLLKFTPTALVMPSSRLILSRLPLRLPSISPSIGEFSHGSAVRIRWPKYWSFSFSISPSNKYSGLISLKIH